MIQGYCSLSVEISTNRLLYWVASLNLLQNFFFLDISRRLGELLYNKDDSVRTFFQEIVLLLGGR